MTGRAGPERLDRLRTTVELIGTVAITATQLAAAVAAITSIPRRRNRCR